MSFQSLPLLALGLALASCTSMRSPIVPGAKPKDHGAIGATEGPVWHNGSLYFTDGKHINRLGPDGKTTVFRHNASNGLAFDKEGRLIACESGLRRVTRTEKDGSITVMADRFKGKRFNTPNDLCIDSKGRVYFTDPRYGSRKGMEISLDTINSRTSKDEITMDHVSHSIDPLLSDPHIEGVYRIDAPGKTTNVMIGGPRLYPQRPNGILISPDDRYMYIADNNNNNHGGSRKLLRYAIDKHGRATDAGKVIFDWKNGRGPDGMKMDNAGRIYVAAGTNKATEFETTEFKAGCYILSPTGRLIDFIPTAPDECCNCAFGGADGKTLFITSGGHLWSVPLR